MGLLDRVAEATSSYLQAPGAERALDRPWWPQLHKFLHHMNSIPQIGLLSTQVFAKLWAGAPYSPLFLSDHWGSCSGIRRTREAMICMPGSCPFLAAHMQREDIAPNSEDYVLEEDRPYMPLAARMIRAASTEDLRSDGDEPLSDASWQQIERQCGPGQGAHPPSAAGEDESASSSWGRLRAVGYLNVQGSGAETSGSESDAPRNVQPITICIDTSGSETEVSTLSAPAELGIDLLDAPRSNEETRPSPTLQRKHSASWIGWRITGTTWSSRSITSRKSPSTGGEAQKTRSLRAT